MKIKMTMMKMMQHRILLLWILLTIILSTIGLASGDNIRKRKTDDEEDKGFANIPKRIEKDYASSNMKMSSQARTRDELEQGHRASAKAARVQVRNLRFESCGNGGTQYVVECVVGTEQYCYKELTDAGAVIVNTLPNSDFFAVCVDTEEEKKLLMELTAVVGLEEDYVRALSFLPELTKPVNRREMQASGQQIPYGVDMVNAPQFWSSKGNQGSGAKVCIIDTGLDVDHEDMQGAIVGGSTANSVVSDWDSDDGGHGTHVVSFYETLDCIMVILCGFVNYL
jgi:subtilisin family serine protease